MNSREVRMNEIIKAAAIDMKYNYNQNYDYNNIYTLITHSGLPKYEVGKKLDVFFPEWIRHFYNKPNIRVFNTENWKYFCQFTNNTDNKPYTDSEQLKIYIPLDSAHIEQGAKILFEYLASQNMKHMSKIGSKSRVDDIVIRVFNKEDAIKVHNFIKNNNYIRQGLMETNPFTVSDGLISYGCDGSLSYNVELSKLLCEYLSVLRVSNGLDTANLNDFKTYVANKIKTYETQEGFRQLASEHRDKYKVLSAYNVSGLILKTLDGKAQVQDLFQHYDNISRKNYRDTQLSNIQKAMNRDLEYKNNTLFQALNETAKKYGRNQAIAALKLYYEENKPNGFTSTNGARMAIASLSKSDIEYIYLRIFGSELKNGGSISSLAANILSNNVADRSVTESFNELEIACSETMRKYDKAFVAGAINDVLTSRNYHGFTRTNNARENLKASMNVRQILITIMSTLQIESFSSYDDLADQYADYISQKFAFQR